MQWTPDEGKVSEVREFREVDEVDEVDEAQIMTDRVEFVRSAVEFSERNRVILGMMVGLMIGFVFGGWFGVILDLAVCWSEVP